MSAETERSPLKAKPLRNPGDSVQDMVVDYAFGRLLPTLWLTALLWTLVLLAWIRDSTGWQPSTSLCFASAALMSVLCAAQLRAAQKRIGSLQLGRDGERLVGELLERRFAARGARVLHDIPGDGFNLDHVLITPQGVFVIETKTRSKPSRGDAQVTLEADGISVGGFPLERDPISQVQRACRWLSELLEESTGKPVNVRGVVVFPGWFVEPMSQQWLTAGRPWVLEPKALPSFVGHEPVALADADISMIAYHLSRYVRARQRAGA